VRESPINVRYGALSPIPGYCKSHLASVKA
jgi:hypothetical protein